jgi:Protein of unknown function (DUF3300)
MNGSRIVLILTFCILLGPAGCSNRQGIAASTPKPQVPPPALQPLDELLAPVALYPDALLAQVLASATSPQQVTEMNNWLEQNNQLQGSDLQDAANQQGFDASFVALALFPDVINMMARNIDWTTELGTAFLSDQKGVMDSVQKLRAQAQAVGNLTATAQQEVTTQTQDGQKVIVIQPANPQIVYVPQYNPQIVYVQAPPAPSASVSAALIGFGIGIAIGSSMNNNYYYRPYGWGAWGMGWHSHTVIVIGRPWVVPPYARYPYVRPIPMPYGGYRPRPYVYAPTNINVNVNRNIYTNGPTPRPKPYTPPATRPTRPITPPPMRPTGPAQLPAQPSTMPATRPNPSSAQRPTPNPSTRPNTSQVQPAVGGAGARGGSLPTTMPQPASRPSTTGTQDYGSRGYSRSPSQVPANAPKTERAQTSTGAFTGYESGNAERAASQRGQRSVSNSQKPARSAGR